MDICNFLVPNSDSTSHIPITLIFDIKNQKTWKRKLAQRKELLDKGLQYVPSSPSHIRNKDARCKNKVDNGKKRALERCLEMTEY